MPNMPHQPVPMPGRSARVQVNTLHLLPPAALRFRAGGCDMGDRAISCELLDVTGKAKFTIPLTVMYAERLHKQLGELVAEHNKRTLGK